MCIHWKFWSELPLETSNEIRNHVWYKKLKETKCSHDAKRSGLQCSSSETVSNAELFMESL